MRKATKADIENIRNEIAQSKQVVKKEIPIISRLKNMPKEKLDEIRILFQKTDEYMKIMNARYREMNRKHLLSKTVEAFHKIQLYQLPNNLNLSDKQLSILCHSLIDAGFISIDTSEDIFIWSLGGKEMPYSIIDLDLTDEEEDKFDNCNIDEYNWSFYFNEKLNENRIVWTKYTSTTNKHHVNKRALLDIMVLLKVPEHLWAQESFCSHFFIGEKGKEIVFNRENYRGFKASKHKSEYHEELTAIISSILEK